MKKSERKNPNSKKMTKMNKAELQAIIDAEPMSVRGMQASRSFEFAKS
jgi:hypothetical protein